MTITKGEELVAIVTVRERGIVNGDTYVCEGGRSKLNPAYLLMRVPGKDKLQMLPDTCFVRPKRSKLPKWW